MSESLHEQATALASVLSNVEKGSSDLDVLVQAMLVAAGVEKSLPASASPLPYTTSANAVLELFENRLPGWEWLRKSPGVVTLYEKPTYDEWAIHVEAGGKTFPLAFLAALLPILTRDRTPSSMAVMDEIISRIPALAPERDQRQDDRRSYRA